MNTHDEGIFIDVPSSIINRHLEDGTSNFSKECCLVNPSMFN